MRHSNVRRLAFVAVALAGVVLAVVGLRQEIALPVPESVTLVEGEATLDAAAATPELAERTVDRLRLFRTGNAGERIALTSDEITALLRHALPGVLPAGITDPAVSLEGGGVVVRARLATAEFVGRAPLAGVLGALPDTVPVDLAGRLEVRRGRLVLHVDEAHAGLIPLPATVVSAIAAEMAAGSADPLPPGDHEPLLSVRWPAGVTLVAVRPDGLVLHRDEPMSTRAVDGSEHP